MKKKAVVSLLVIGLAVLAIAGGTLAWFTWQVDVDDNVFTAGTLKIEAGESWVEGFEVENWNPGDCEDKEVWVKVTGSKGVYLRFKINDGWWQLNDDEEWVEWNLGMLVNPVSYGLNDAWVKKSDGWYYYTGGRVEPESDEINAISKVCLLGSAGNDFQGKQYRIGFEFEAIQTTHEAVFEAWKVGYIDCTFTDSNGQPANIKGWYPVNKVDDIWTMVVGLDKFEWTPTGAAESNVGGWNPATP